MREKLYDKDDDAKIFCANCFNCKLRHNRIRCVNEHWKQNGVGEQRKYSFYTIKRRTMADCTDYTSMGEDLSSFLQTLPEGLIEAPEPTTRNMQMTDKEKLLDLEAAAAYLVERGVRFSSRTIKKWVQRKEVDHYRLGRGGKLYFTTEALDGFVERRKKTARPQRLKLGKIA